MSRRFLPFPRNLNAWLTLLLAPTLSLSAQTASSPKEGTTIDIADIDSPPVHGDPGIGHVTVDITEDGSIDVANEAAIRGDGENWAIKNSGLLRQRGNAEATVHLSEGTFTNEETGEIIWESDADLSLSTDGENGSFSSIFIESWTAHATNKGEIRATALHNFVIDGSNISASLTGLYLGAREKDESDTPLLLENEGTISAEWSGNLEMSGSGNHLRVTGVHLEEMEWLDNHETIEAVFNGNIDEWADGNSLKVTGVRADGGAVIYNRAEGIIRAKIDATGTAADDANATATAILSEGDLGLENSGRIEAIVTDGFPQAEAAGIIAQNGGDITNQADAEILAQHDGSGTATGISIALADKTPVQPDENDNGDNDENENGDQNEPDPRRLTITNYGTIAARAGENGTASGITIALPEEIPVLPDENPNGDNGDGENGDDGENGNGEEEPEPFSASVNNHGTIAARAGDGGNVTAIYSDGHLKLSNSGTIEAGGIILSDEDEEEIETADVANATGIHVQNGKGNITNSGTISAEGGMAVHLENGGSLKNTGSIIGDVFLGEGDATLTIDPTAEFDGNVNAGSGGEKTLELIDDGTFSQGYGEYSGEFENFSKLHVDAANSLLPHQIPGTIWRLKNDQTYLDGTLIESGDLWTTDRLISDVTVNEHGRLISSGVITGNLDVSGEVWVGTLHRDDDPDASFEFIAPEEGGILEVVGDVTFEDGSYLYVIVGETSLEATGDITIGSQDPENGDRPAPQLLLILGEDMEWEETYNLLSGDTLTGEFEGENSYFGLIIDSDDSSIKATKAINRDAIREAGETSSERSLARVLADAEPVAGSDFEAAYREFAEIGNVQNFGALAQSMNGEILASGTAAHSSINRSVRQTVINTIQYRPSLYDDRFAPPPGTSFDEIREREQNLWARTLSIWGDLERPNDGGDVDYRLHGVVAGYDTVWTQDARLGVAVALGDTKVSYGPDKIEGNVYQVLLYASKHEHGFLYDATLGYGYHDLDSRRRIVPGDRTSTASYGAHEIFGSAQVTMVLQEEGVLILPMAGIEFSHFRQESFRESGAWGLSASSTDFSSFRPFIGVRILAEHLTGGGGSVVPELRFRLSNEFLDRDARFSASFANDTNGGRFSTTGAEFNRTEFEAGVGVMVQPGGWEQVSIFGDYDFSVQRQHAVSVGLRYNF
ncbi:MAG TPA: autotransporter outer membrane beta-barrel domain-containing protein [Opitutales bacterium]|nr:autotransporter outer membrane beta-barrel domain-containing protein [Opitutales bacterium]